MYEINCPDPRPEEAPAARLAYQYRLSDIILAWVCWLAGFMLCVIIPIGKCLWGAFAFEVVLFVGALVLVGLRNRVCIVRAAVQAAVSILLSCAFLLTTNQAIIVCVFLFTVVSWFYMVFVLSGSSVERFPGDSFVREAAVSVFATPIHAPGNIFMAIFSNRRSEDGQPGKARFGKVFGLVLLGFAVAMIPTIIVGVLLSYDKGFSDLLGKMFDLKAIGKVIHRVSVGLAIAALLFGALLTSLTKSMAGRRAADPAEAGNGTHILPVVAGCAALFPVLFLYVVFFVSQWSYYMSAFTGVLPEGLTYANYAREGFFQLCTVVGINAALAVLASVFTKRRAYDPERPDRDRVHPALRIALTILSLFTLVLIATALSKMILYVDTYGLTQKRVYSTWLMLLLAAAFIAVPVKQAWHKMNLVGTLLCVFLVFFLAISLVNVDSLIVNYNVDACLDGNVRTMESNKAGDSSDVLYDAGASGVLPALRFMEETAGSDDPAILDIRVKTEKYLQKQAATLSGQSFWEKNFVSLKAEHALRDAAYMDLNQVPDK